jgi:hypothetical protein
MKLTSQTILHIRGRRKFRQQRCSMAASCMVRQGDILLMPVSALPSNAQPVSADSNGRIVLAHGEATGHAHAFMARSVSMLRAPDETVFLHVTKAAWLRHEEHAPIWVRPGRYRVVRQREYNPAVKQHRVVAD